MTEGTPICHFLRRGASRTAQGGNGRHRACFRGCAPVFVFCSLLLMDARTLPAGPEETSRGSTDPNYEVALNVESWRRAWEARDGETFCAHYSARFPDRAAYCSRKTEIFSRSGEIHVVISDLQVSASEDGFKASFVQAYRSAIHSDAGRKQLWWVRETDGWRILREGWTALPEPEPDQPSQDRTEAPVAGTPADPQGVSVLKGVTLRENAAGAFVLLDLDGRPSVAVTPEPVDGVIRVSIVPARADLRLLPPPAPGGVIKDLRIRQPKEGPPIVILELLVGEEGVQAVRPVRSDRQILIRLKRTEAPPRPKE